MPTTNFGSGKSINRLPFKPEPPLIGGGLYFTDLDIEKIAEIFGPSEKVQLAAVKKDGFYIRGIKDPSEAVQLAAVKQDGDSIQLIKNPSEAVQLAAVNQCRFSIDFIKNPTNAVKLAAGK